MTLQRRPSKKSTAIRTRLITLRMIFCSMDLEETIDYLAEELDLERSEHVHNVGQSVARLRD